MILLYGRVYITITKKMLLALENLVIRVFDSLSCAI